VAHEETVVMEPARGFLADESCDVTVVRALRVAGHDVAAIAETSPRATDEIVLELAIRETRDPAA
jgi:hypothetical protein